MANQQPIFVAHRGYPEKYPENSLIGLSASLQQGALLIKTVLFLITHLNKLILSSPVKLNA